MLTKETIEYFFKHTKNHLTISGVDPLEIKSMYVTATGKFGSAPSDASWDMIDEIYTLDIMKDSLFTNCYFDKSWKVIDRLKQNQMILPTEQFIEDYNLAKNDGNLDLFFYSLTEENLREYLTDPYKRSRKIS